MLNYKLDRIGDIEDSFNLEEELTEYLGSRYLSPELANYLKSLATVHSNEFYRGLPFPKHLIRKGHVIKEWHGSCHWSRSKAIALNFAILSRDGYINEDYYLQLQQELQTDKVPFVQMILVCEKLTGTYIPDLLEKCSIKEFISEEEIVTIGKEYVIDNYEIKNIDGEKVYFVKVEELD